MIKLRKIALAQDSSYIFDLVKNHADMSILLGNSRFNNFEEFCHWLEDRMLGYFHDFFIIEDNSDSETRKRQGFVLSYDYRVYDSHCKIYGYFESGIGKIALKQFMNILFREYPLNKIFLVITDINVVLLDTAQILGFKQEAVLCKNKFVNGKYHDLLILSLYSQYIGERI